LKIEQWPISKVSKYAKNSKTHPPQQLEHLKASIKEFGFVNPCLVDARGVLIAGHARVECAVALGMKRIPVIKLGHLSPAQTIALRIADNSLPVAGGAGWDAQMLELELKELGSINFNLEPLGLDNIQLPDIEDLPVQPPRSNRSKTTIFLSIKNEVVEKARKTIITALDKAGIAHNL